ncbi:CDP-glycerol glycerophosphotransferase family protein [Bacillus sp. NPDC077027]|uniref:CDP-glycerol glycerophosphotransferase family protein n=1 Tax=Bacillus sp. NPDC077027 TaxID=3390548 RepID=UPI003CFCEB8F
MNLRSIVTLCYAAFVSLLGFILQRVKSEQNHVTLLVSFEENASALIEAYKQQQETIPMKLTVLYTKHASALKQDEPHMTFRYFNEKNPFHLIQTIYTLFKSKVVVTDNYFLMTSVLRDRKSTTCIQVWHANGALKKFGLEDASNAHRSKRDIERFKRVYASFDYVVIGSDRMGEIFKRSFGIEDKQLLSTGIPLTDAYFHTKPQYSLPSHIPQDKKILLYAPTYRDFDRSGVVVPFEREQLRTQLNGEYILLVKLHPAVKHLVQTEADQEWIFDVSHEPLHDLLRTCDVLITDYSSIVFEYALLHRPVLFFTYDLETYRQKRGLVDGYEKIIPGKACLTQDMLIDELSSLDQQNIASIQAFAEEWNHYSQGHSAKQLFEFIQHHLIQKKRPASH